MFRGRKGIDKVVEAAVRAEQTERYRSKILPANSTGVVSLASRRATRLANANLALVA